MGKYNIRDMRINCFESLRLKYRPISYEDIKDVYEYGADPETCIFLNWGPYKCVEEAQEFVETKILSGDLQWVIIHKEKEKVIGGIRLYDFNETEKSASISYVLNRQYCGQGYMTESLKVIFEIGRQILGLERMYTYYVGENTSSENVMQRAGMKKDPEFLEHIVIKGRNYKEYRYVKEVKI